MKKLISIFLTLMLALGCTAALSEDAQSTATKAPQSDTLIAYFSATGTTEAVALLIAQSTGADVYKIEPEVPYTDADLNYNNSSSRANKEMDDNSARPAIAGETPENMDAYDVIYLGFPIWWGDAPRIIDTFLETYDLSGKTIIPFCTSGSSGISRSINGIKALAPDATVLDGARLNNATAESVAAWISGLSLEAAQEQGQ